MAGDKYDRPVWKAPDMHAYTGSVMSINPSGRGQDETGYAVMKNLFANLYVPAAGGLKGGYEETVLVELANSAKRHKVNPIIIESNFGMACSRSS